MAINVLACNMKRVMAFVGVSALAAMITPWASDFSRAACCDGFIIGVHLLPDVAAPRTSPLTEGPQWLQERPTRYYAGRGIKWMETTVIPIEELGELASRIGRSQSPIGICVLFSV
jgi:hypothetical protein